MSSEDPIPPYEPSSLRVQVANAIVAALNGQAFPQVFTAVRRRVPVDDVAELAAAGLLVSVIPKSYAEELASRSSVGVTLLVDIGVQKKLGSLSDSELDPLDDLVEEIIAFFRRLTLEDFPAATWLGTANEMIWSPEHMADDRVFTSVITLTYQVTQ